MPRNPVLRNIVARGLPPTFDVGQTAFGKVLIKPKQWHEVLCQADRMIEEVERAGYAIIAKSDAIPKDRLEAMLATLERVTLITSDEPQSAVQSVYMELRSYLVDVPMPWCERCQSYHHVNAPGCFAKQEQSK